MKICFVVATAFWLCSLCVAGQEPADTTVIVNDTVEVPALEVSSDTLIILDTQAPVTIDRQMLGSDIFLMSDTIDWLSILSAEDIEAYFKHSPAKAAMMSAVLPGLGQVYNRKYWKIPIVYAAIGITMERFITFQNEYNKFRRAYITFNDGDPYTNFHDTIFPSNFSDTEKSQIINRAKDRYRTWRDWSIVAVVAAYGLGIIDANVDAHLMDFSIDDNISLQITPIFFDNVFAYQKIGLSLRVFF